MLIVFERQDLPQSMKLLIRMPLLLSVAKRTEVATFWRKILRKNFRLLLAGYDFSILNNNEFCNDIDFV